MEQVNFSILPRTIAHLGEDLIKNESIAILELVKNAYDACASQCQVYFETDDNNNLIKIIITDDGFGMDKHTISNSWLVIGTDFKNLTKEANACGRFPLGEKGIGRLGVHKLGNKIKLVSKSLNKKEVEVNIDWNLLNTSKTLTDFYVNISENEFPNTFTNKNISGTKIIIEDIKGSWDKKLLREVYRNLTSLNSPFADEENSFKVEIKNNSNIFEGLPSFKDIVESALYFGKCKLSGNKITEFSYEFKPWSNLNKIDKGRVATLSDFKIPMDLILKGDKDEEGKNKPVEYEINLDDLQIGDITFDLCIFEKDSQIFNYCNAEKKSVNNYLKQNGGIRVYRDNMRVYDYGEQANDWLGIDLRRVHRVGGNVSNNIILGSVRIERAKSYGLREKTNREGFIENSSYKAFVDAIDYVLSFFVKERNIDKERLSVLYKGHKAAEPVLSDLDNVTKIVENKIANGEDKKEILKYLHRIADQYKDTKDILIRSANAGLNLSVVIHEIEKLMASLIGYINKENIDSIKRIALQLEKIIRNYSVMIRKSSTGLFSLSQVVKIAIENYDFRFLDHRIQILSNYKENELKAFFSESVAISVIINLLDNAIYWLSYARTENRKIAIHITDKIEEGYGSVIISDNGPGFNIPFDVAVKPFITGKPHNKGTGLGLHVVNEMMHAMKGQLLLLDKNEIELPDYIKKNNVTKTILALSFPLNKYN